MTDCVLNSSSVALAKVEITDPFSNQSPAAEWGWKKYDTLEF